MEIQLSKMVRTRIFCGIRKPSVELHVHLSSRQIIGVEFLMKIMALQVDYEPGYRQMNFRVSPELFQAVEDEARAHKVSKSKFLGRIVAAAIDGLRAERASA